MNIELAVTGITQANRREKLLKSVRALSDQMGLRPFVDAPWLGKAGPHKYISKKWENGAWVYTYPGEDTEDRNAGQSDLPVVTGVARQKVDETNYLETARAEFSKLRAKIKAGLFCAALGGRKVVDAKETHLVSKHGERREEKDIIGRVSVMQYIIPIIEYGKKTGERKNPHYPGNYYEISMLISKGKKVSVILADKGDGCLYVSVMPKKMIGKALHKSIRQMSGTSGCPNPSADLPYLAVKEQGKKALCQGSHPLPTDAGSAFPGLGKSLPYRAAWGSASRLSLWPPHNISIPHVYEKSMHGYPDLEVSITNITPENRKEKFAKAVRAVSENLGVPVTVEERKRKGGQKGEPFFYRAQEELAYRWYNFFSAAVNDAYRMVVSYFALPEIRTLSKADVLKYRGKTVYSPETGQPIKRSQWNDFVKLLDRFLERRLDGADRMILDGKTLGRILARMLKYNKLDEVTETQLKDVKYHGKTFDWISGSVKNMCNALGEGLSRGEMARIQVMQQSAAQRVTQVSDAMRNDIKQILINGLKDKKGKSQISQDLFDRMTGHNRDFRKIADTEMMNAVNNSFLMDEAQAAGPGEKVYFQRVEAVDSNTCGFCRKMNGTVVLWSDRPLPDDRIKDPVAKYAIWDGKEWDGRKDFVASGVFHPYCRGIWARYWDGAVDALVAHTRNEGELYDMAIDRARAEYKKKGVDMPHDKTPGFVERVNGLYSEKKSYGPDPDRGNGAEYTEAFNLAREEFAGQGITHPTGRTPGFRERVQEIYEGLLVGKSLTWSGHRLQDRIKFAGFNISVENRKGSYRSGTDRDGHEWKCLMHFSYGYIRGTEGTDGDHVDVYVGSSENAANVYIVRQNDPVTGKYDEDKVMLGFSSMHEARSAYLKQYDRPGFLGRIDAMPLEEFREKVLSGKYRGKMVKSFAQRVREIGETA